MPDFHINYFLRSIYQSDFASWVLSIEPFLAEMKVIYANFSVCTTSRKSMRRHKQHIVTADTTMVSSLELHFLKQQIISWQIFRYRLHRRTFTTVNFSTFQLSISVHGIEDMFLHPKDNPTCVTPVSWHKHCACCPPKRTASNGQRHYGIVKKVYNHRFIQLCILKWFGDVELYTVRLFCTAAFSYTSPEIWNNSRLYGLVPTLICKTETTIWYVKLSLVTATLYTRKVHGKWAQSCMIYSHIRQNCK